MAAGLPAVEPGTLGSEVTLAGNGSSGSDQVICFSKPLLGNSQHFAAAGSDRKI